MNDKLTAARDAIQKLQLIVDRWQYDAEMNGENGDGGAAVIRSQITFWRLGSEHVIPPAWNEMIMVEWPKIEKERKREEARDREIFDKLRAKYGW